MSGKNDEFSINIGDDILAEALQAVEKRLYKDEDNGGGASESEPEILVPGGFDDEDYDSDELDIELDFGEEDDFDDPHALLKEQLQKALSKNAKLEQEVRDSKDETRRIGAKIKRLSDSNAQLKIDVRDSKETLTMWQDQIGELKSSLQEADSHQANLRAKHKRDLEEAGSAGLTKSLKALLTPIDHIELSFSHLDEDIPKDSPLHGLKMSFEELQAALEKIQLVKVDASPGTLFDPECHEAIARVSSEEYGDNQITEVHRAGYRHGKRLLRAAQVTVCAGTASKEE